MKMYECLSFANRPETIGGYIPSLIFDAATIDSDYVGDVITPMPGDPAGEWNEARLKDVLWNRRGAKNLIIVNAEALPDICPGYLESDTVNDRRVGELRAWLQMVRRFRHPGAKIALNVPIPILGMDAWGNWNRNDCEEAGRRVRRLWGIIRSEVMPLADYPCVQSYWLDRWGNFEKDLYGAGEMFGNRHMWEVHGKTMMAFIGKPAIALFSPSTVPTDEAVPFRELTDEEWNQSMYHLSSVGFAGVALWGTVPGRKTKQGWNIYDQHAPWLERAGRYCDADGNFVPDPRWPAEKKISA